MQRRGMSPSRDWSAIQVVVQPSHSAMYVESTMWGGGGSSRSAILRGSTVGPETPQVVPEAGVRLRDAARLQDRDPLGPQADRREGHRHPVIVVGRDPGRPDPVGREDDQAVGMLVHGGAEL